MVKTMDDVGILMPLGCELHAKFAEGRRLEKVE